MEIELFSHSDSYGAIRWYPRHKSTQITIGGRKLYFRESNLRFAFFVEERAMPLFWVDDFQEAKNTLIKIATDTIEKAREPQLTATEH